MKQLTAEQVDVIDELLFEFLEKKKKLDFVDIPKALANAKSFITKGNALVLVDDKENPTCFLYGVFVDAPLFYTNLKQFVVISHLGDKSQTDTLVKMARRKSKIRGCDSFFLNKVGSGSIFETSNYEKL